MSHEKSSYVVGNVLRSVAGCHEKYLVQTNSYAAWIGSYNEVTHWWLQVNPLSSEIVKNWFKDEFEKLAPELQELHLAGGVLEGQVEIVLGVGPGGLLGKRLIKKMNIPAQGTHNLTVNISHDEHCLHWDRRFNDSVEIKSTFKPVGTIGSGYWIEKTGSVELRLTVDIKNRGWYWRCLGIKCFGIPLPVWLFPKLDAYKYSENGGYNFYVGFTAPIVGLLFSYSGSLQTK